MTWRADDPQGNEAAKIRYDIVRYTRGKVLDMGCGPIRAFDHFIGVDSCKDTELFGIEIHPGVKCDVADPEAIAKTFVEESVDAVFSSHCLEHIEDPEAALAAWWKLIKVGGYLVLYLPHRDLYPRIGEPGGNPDHKWDFHPDNIVDIMRRVVRDSGGWDLVLNETRDQGQEYSFLQVYQKLEAGIEFACDRPKERPTACVVRYGAIGDMIQAAGVAAALKQEGYHVTMLCEPHNSNVIQHDPHVDSIWIQDKDQILNQELGPFFEATAKRFDRFINLCECVEGTLLAIPGRMNHGWPAAVRRKYLDLNYLEFMAELAELRSPIPEHHFYASSEEYATARRVIDSFGAKLNPDWKMGMQYRRPFVVLWALAGSSVHKFWPHQDDVINRLLARFPDAFVILTGDEAGKILEAGWEDHPRVLCTAGEWTLRGTLTMAQNADLVIGPETGVLNSVAFEPNAKIVFLSHSSAHNLTKHWANTWALEPEDTACYPCHQLHFGHEFCPQHEESGAALCQWNLGPDQAWRAVCDVYSDWNQTMKLRSVA